MTKRLRFALLIALTPLMAGAALAAGPGGGGGGGGGGASIGGGSVHGSGTTVQDRDRLRDPTLHTDQTIDRDRDRIRDRLDRRMTDREQDMQSRMSEIGQAENSRERLTLMSKHMTQMSKQMNEMNKMMARNGAGTGAMEQKHLKQMAQQM